MIRVYRAKQIGTGTHEDPYRSILHNFIDIARGDNFQEIDMPSKRFSICLLDAPKSAHDAIVAYEAANPGTVNYLSSLHADMVGLRTQYSQPWADLPLAFRTKAENILGVDGLADFSGSVKQVFKRLILKYFQAQKLAANDLTPVRLNFKFGGDDF